MEKSTCVICAATAVVYCENDKAFLCQECDLSVHSSNCLASKHCRVPICDLCNSKAARVFCRNDRAFLCEACDSTVHLSNPLAARHDLVSASLAYQEQTSHCIVCAESDGNTFSNSSASPSESRKEAYEDAGCSLITEFAPNLASKGSDFEVVDSKDLLCASAFDKDMEAFDMDNEWLDRLELYYNCSDLGDDSEDLLNDKRDLFEDLPSAFSSPTHEFSSITSSVKTACEENALQHVPERGKDCEEKVYRGLTRRQRVLRYLEKRKSRKFQKTIRYASRKAYAEIRPRFKGRFVKREDLQKFGLDTGAMLSDEAC